jgi:hypothetical protein
MNKIIIAGMAFAFLSVSAESDTLRWRIEDDGTMIIQTAEGMHMFLRDETAPARKEAAKLFGKINPGTTHLFAGLGFSLDFDHPMTREGTADEVTQWAHSLSSDLWTIKLLECEYRAIEALFESRQH